MMEDMGRQMVLSGKAGRHGGNLEAGGCPPGNKHTLNGSDPAPPGMYKTL